MSDRQALQAAGVHPAPCARHCEATAFEIEIRRLQNDYQRLMEKHNALHWNAKKHRDELAACRSHQASIRALIADDGYALSFQTLGQYRAALLRAIDQGAQS